MTPPGSQSYSSDHAKQQGGGPPNPVAVGTHDKVPSPGRVAVIGGGYDGNQRPPSQGRGSPRQQVASSS